MKAVTIYPEDPSTVVNTAATNTAAVAKATGGVFLGADVYNSHTAVVFLQVFGVPAASVTLGTTVPIASYAIPAEGIRYIEPFRPPVGDTGISYAVTATRNGSGAPGATASLQLHYK